MNQSSAFVRQTWNHVLTSLVNAENPTMLWAMFDSLPIAILQLLAKRIEEYLAVKEDK